MRKLWILFLLLLISSCSNLKPEPTTSWNKANYSEIDGIVEIATGWANSHLCTGSLIRNNMVLTAAHCAVFPAEDLYIVYGCNDIDDWFCKKVPVKRIFLHPKWNKDFLSTNDLAILIPKEPIPLKLAKISSRKNLAKGLSVKAVGFGRRNGDSGVLYSGRGRIVTDYQYELIARMNGRLDPNPGDSGGPLLILEEGEFRIVGILSRSKWGALSKKEIFVHSGRAIYTKPIMYLDWISEMSYRGAICTK